MSRSLRRGHRDKTNTVKSTVEGNREEPSPYNITRELTLLPGTSTTPPQTSLCFQARFLFVLQPTEDEFPVRIIPQNLICGKPVINQQILLQVSSILKTGLWLSLKIKRSVGSFHNCFNTTQMESHGMKLEPRHLSLEYLLLFAKSCLSFQYFQMSFRVMNASKTLYIYIYSDSI